ncbi:MAG: DUF362 domain-containing protein [bacterium]|nr:DUF362 domain-containing protein [bacterium]
MKKNNENNSANKKLSRREFLGTVGLTTAGLLVAPYIKTATTKVLEYPSFSAQVAITKADNYDRALIKQKVQHLFESIGGIGDVIKPGDKVAIKINLTGGSGSASSPKLDGKPITESMWTHPEVLRAVAELIIDSGVSANDIYFVEALWDAASYNNFGYLDVQQNLGTQLVNLNKKEPYADFIDKEVGENHFFYSSFKLNQILADVDVYVSIPKMKQHYEAGVTHSLKNQIGIVPIQYYKQNSWDGMRSRLHFEGGDIGTHLPHSICDLNLARPVHLAVIDGIKNAIGGEGVWNPTYKTAEYHVLLAGKNPVAADSVASYVMGNDPEAEKLQLPDGIRQCDNYLELLHQKGMGTNQMSEIEVVGDGAGLVTSTRPEREVILLDSFQLCQNFPNPFNPATAIIFYLPHPEHVTITIYNVTGQEIETLVQGTVPAGKHELHWIAKNLPSGVYICKMQAGRFSDAKKLIYQK